MDWSHAISASDGGGLQELIKAAQREGQLNLVRPADSAGWIANVQGFQQRYGIQVTLLTTVSSDADQVGAVTSSRGSHGAPDVLDLSPAVAETNASLFAPYLVFYWQEIPAALKNARAYWYEDCGGYMAIGYDPTRVAAVTTVEGLLNPDLADAIALAGDPAVDEGALTAVVMAAVAAGGTVDDVAPGVSFFQRLRGAGNLGKWGAAVPPPVLIDWDFAQPGLFPNNRSWSYVVPPEAAVAAYRAQAISRFAPHPAAARLWEEYLLSDAGQNACLKLGARPSRLLAMRAEGTLDLGAAAALTPVGGTTHVVTAQQLAAARAYVAAHWAAAVGQ